ASFRCGNVGRRLASDLLPLPSFHNQSFNSNPNPILLFHNNLLVSLLQLFIYQFQQVFNSSI
ncbi:hypothetical protein, partial [Sulfuricurvum sp.]|uniref:hypothetical protein n=1 Tax=Sulfuricurvum sp. TaxID=2025608 RepID=UPI003BB1F764